MKQFSILSIVFAFLIFGEYNNLYPQDVLTLLHSSNSGLAAKIKLIEEAQYSLDLSYYALDEDESGKYILSRLLMASARGVKVRIIVENHFSSLSNELLTYLMEHHISVKYYNPFRIKKGFKNMSWMHDKLIIADGKSMITGGRNINNAYYELPYPTDKKFIDIEVQIDGNKSALAQQYYEHLWHSSYTGNPRIKARKIDEASYNFIQSEFESLKRTNWALENAAPVAEKYYPDSIEFIHDYFYEWPKSQNVTRKVLNLIRDADSSIVIESPYAITPNRTFRRLRNAVKRGVKVRIVSNAPSATDVLIAAAGFINDRKKYLDSNIEIWEYNGPHTLHSKTVVFDNQITMIGSYNFDNLSYEVNSEIIALIYDSKFSKSVAHIMQDRLLGSVKINAKDYRDPALDEMLAKQLKKYRILLKTFPFIKRFI